MTAPVTVLARTLVLLLVASGAWQRGAATPTPAPPQPSAIPPATLPAGFDLADRPDMKWVRETVQTPRVTIDFSYPANWKRMESSHPILVADLQSFRTAGVKDP